jgi:Uma2 family endonuclease
MISRVRHLTLEQYEEMVDRGDFEEARERMDLIRGELHIMSPAGPDHADIVNYLSEWSFEWAKRYGYQARSEKCVTFTDHESMPEPDIVWVKRRRYRKAHPTDADVGLVIEVADSSLRKDRGVMADLYADAGIAEYWIVNCLDNCIEVYRQPQDGAYQEQFIVRPGKKVSPLVAPDAELDVAELFTEE